MKKNRKIDAAGLDGSAAVLLHELREINRACGKWQPNPRTFAVAYFGAVIRFLMRAGDKTVIPANTMYQMMFEELPPMLPDWLLEHHADMRARFGLPKWQPQVIDGGRDDGAA